MSFIEYAEVLQQKSEHVTENLKSEISEFITGRKIEKILHFTHIENLPSILENGILNQKELVSKKIPFKPSDRARQDELESGICCSITLPNRLMMQYKIREFGSMFAVIEMPADVLLFKRFACFPSNAARTDIRLLARKAPMNFVGVDGLSNLYLNWIVRWASKLEDSQPTDSQSEIVIFDTIPLMNIRQIHFSPYTPTETIESVKKLADKYEGINLEFNCPDGFFDSELSSEYTQRNYQLDWK
jgi:hypothetical protein